MFKQASLILAQLTGDGSQTPVLVGLVKLSGVNTFFVKFRLQRLEIRFVSNSKVDQRWVMVRWTTMTVSVFDCGMPCLNSLLRDWDITACDGIDVILAVLRFHHFLLS